MAHEPFADWEARLDAWLSSLPSGHPVLLMDEIDQCQAFSEWEEKNQR